MDRMRICANINLDAIEENIRQMERVLPRGKKIMAVVKTDGYGHGALPIASHIQDEEILFGFAVATLEEALELKQGGIKKPILILGYTFADTYDAIVANEIRPTIFTEKMAADYEEVGARLGKKVHVHIKIDTGMGRIGYRVSEKSADTIRYIFENYPHLEPEGIFTHFARADELDKTATDLQFERFQTMLSWLRERKVTFPLVHASNSASIMEYPTPDTNLVRAGIILYGLRPSDEVDKSYPIYPALSLTSHIAYIKTVREGDAISYGGTYVAKERRRIATIPVGYGDGYSRGLSNKGYVLIRGKRAPIVGRVCMDQFMADVTAIKDAEILDEVTLVGRDGDEEITLEELGERSGRFNYEFACDLGNRIPRVYSTQGKTIDSKEYY